MSNLYKKIGDFIEIVDRRNKDLKVSNLLGVSIQKKFIKSIANVKNTNMSNYRVISKNQFAYSPVTSRNGNKITIALYKEDKEAILSPAYTVFKIKDEDKLLPEYLFLYFNRAEFDRYARFHSWGSARETFDWDSMCETKIPIPDIKVQKKYVNIYKALQKNQSIYEKSLKDLEFVTQGYMEKLIKSEPHQKLGDFIEEVNERNSDNAIKEVMGMSVNKAFREASSKVNKNSLSSYKIVKKDQFAFVQTTHNEKKLVIALSDFDYPIIVSSVNIVFQVKDTTKLLPEYLYMFFNRAEFDRYARFHSWGSARETFTFEDIQNVKLPIPSIEKQKAIVTIYKVLQKRKKINEQLKQKLTSIAPVLIRGVVVESLK